jgi:hypothetical protein
VYMILSLVYAFDTIVKIVFLSVLMNKFIYNNPRDVLGLNKRIKSKLVKSSMIVNKLRNNGMKNSIKLCLQIVL